MRPFLQNQDDDHCRTKN